MSFWGDLLLRAQAMAFDLIDLLGARGARWEWRKRAWRQALETRIAGWENLGRGVRTRMRMCPGCRALVEGRGSACPACGASLAGVEGGGVGRLLRLLLPGAGSASMILVTVIVAFSALTLALGSAAGEAGAARLLSPSGRILYLLGAKSAGAILDGQVWRLVTANYLHGGIIHLLFNCYALMSLGPLIEESFGGRKLFVIYTACGIAGLSTSVWLNPRALSIGASGALFGLIGFAVVFGRYRGGGAGRALSAQLMRWLIFGVVLILVPGIDHAAHFGGAACGAGLALIVDPGAPRGPAAERTWWLLAGVTLAATLGSFGAMAWSYQDNLRALQG